MCAVASDSFVTAADVDAAMGQRWTERLRGTGESHVIAVDIGAVHNPAVIGVGHHGNDGRVFVDRLVTLQGSRERPVQITALESTIRDLAAVLAPLSKMRIEGWGGMAPA